MANKFVVLWEGEMIGQFDTMEDAQEAGQAQVDEYYGSFEVAEYDPDNLADLFDDEYDFEDDGQPSWEQEWEDFGETGYDVDYIY